MALDHVDEFIANLRADGHPLAEAMSSYLAELDLLSESSASLAQLNGMMSWILKQPRTANEKLKAMERLSANAKAMAGKVETINMNEFTGWHTNG
jgi:hypothetical protein